MQSRRHDFDAELSERCKGVWRNISWEHDLASCEAEEEWEYGPMELFFGCRHEQRDFLYRELLQRMEEKHVLTKLHTAFSRDSAHKVYVQDKMREAAPSILN